VGKNSLAVVPNTPTTKKRKTPPLGTLNRTPAAVKREIKALETCLARANRDFFRASQAIAEKGVSAVKTQTDSRGYSFKAVRVGDRVHCIIYEFTMNNQREISPSAANVELVPEFSEETTEEWSPWKEVTT